MAKDVSRPGLFGRLFALAIDLLFLFVVGLIIGNIFEVFFTENVVFAHVIGWVIGSAYFTVLNGKLTMGTTLGKVLTRIQVLDHQGQNIHLLKSFIRCQFILVPWLLIGQHIPNELQFPFMAPILSLLIGGFLFLQAMCYLILRRGLHDFVLRTQVINIGTSPADVPKTPITFWPPVIIVLIASLIWPFTPAGYPIDKKVAEFAQAYDVLDSTEWVLTYDRVLVAEPYGKVEEGKERKRFLTFDVFMKDYPESKQQLQNRATNLHEQINEIVSLPEGVDGIAIEIRWGFDLGIASRWEHHVDYFESKPESDSPNANQTDNSTS